MIRLRFVLGAIALVVHFKFISEKPHHNALIASVVTVFRSLITMRAGLRVRELFGPVCLEMF